MKIALKIKEKSSLAVQFLAEMIVRIKGEVQGREGKKKVYLAQFS